MTRPLITATLIARNEKQNVRRCLNSLWDAVDEVVIVDTGSSDGTLGAAHAYAKERRQPDKLKTGSFKWRDDFSAARQAADDLATGEWVVWADFDDTVNGLDELRKLAAEAPAEVRAYFCRYTYAKDPDGNPISELWRERLVRNDGTPWQGRLHEHKLFDTGGTIVRVDPNIAEWVHHRDHEQRTGERNIRILEAWDRDDPGNPRVMISLAMEYMGSGRYKDASDMYARFLAGPREPGDFDRRAQATRHMCQMLMVQGRVEEARQAALSSLHETWLWADTHLTLAETEQTLGRPHVGLQHARTALEIGKPNTLLIVNPLQYTAHPRALMAVCLAQLGQLEQAVEQAHECLQIAPSYQLVTQLLPAWRGQLKRQQTVDSILALVEVMVEVGELVKARELIGCAPYFVADDPRLIGRRGDLDRAIAHRRAQPAVLEDEAADLFVNRHLELAA